MKSAFLTCLAILSIGVVGCEEYRTDEFPNADGTAKIIAKTTYGGGAAGYAYTDWFVETQGSSTRPHLLRYNHGSLTATWRGARAIAVCGEATVEFAQQGRVPDTDLTVEYCPAMRLMLPE